MSHHTDLGQEAPYSITNTAFPSLAHSSPPHRHTAQNTRARRGKLATACVPPFQQLQQPRPRLHCLAFQCCITSVTNMAGPTQATVLDNDRPPSIRDNLGCSPTLFNVGKMASSASLPTSHAPPIHPAPPFLPFLSQEGGEEPRSHPSRATPLPSTASSSGATPRRQDRRSERLTSLVRSTTNRHNQSKRPSGKKKLARDAARLHQQPSTDRPLIRSVANGELSPGGYSL